MMHFMKIDDHAHEAESAATHSYTESSFEDARMRRYERLSLLTLDLAEEAGECARSIGYVESGGTTPRKQRGAKARFTQGLENMSRAIWAHQVIERLRTGKPNPVFANPAKPSQQNAGQGPLTSFDEMTGFPDFSADFGNDFNNGGTPPTALSLADQEPDGEKWQGQEFTSDDICDQEDIPVGDNQSSPSQQHPPFQNPQSAPETCARDRDMDIEKRLTEILRELPPINEGVDEGVDENVDDRSPD